jgi:hypothetical protein
MKSLARKSLVIAGAMLLASCTPEIPKDEALLASFDSHRGDYERLRSMVVEDRAVTIELGESGVVSRATSNANALGSNRVEEYLQLMTSSGIRACYNHFDDEFIEFETVNVGWPTCTFAAGYVYSESAPSQRFDYVKTVSRIDAYKKSGYDAVRHIDGRWYLYIRTCRD